jgi:hypothetical protein
LRTARALADSPISASSAAACTTVPISSVPDGGSDRRAGVAVRPVVVGERLGAGFGFAAGAFGFAAAAFGFAAAAFGFAAAALGFAAAALGFAAAVAVGFDVAAGFAAVRFALRRWGRVRGSEPRMSGLGSSLM